MLSQLSSCIFELDEFLNFKTRFILSNLQVSVFFWLVVLHFAKYFHQLHGRTQDCFALGQDDCAQK